MSKKAHRRSFIAKASGNGLAPWWAQRLSALGLLLLIPWILFQLKSHSFDTHDHVMHWIQSPFNATATLMLVGLSFYHGYLGLRVIMEDYVSNHGLRLFLTILTKFLFIALSLLCAFIIFHLTLGSAHVPSL